MTGCKSNCLLFAIAQWWKRGGYLIIRRSHHGWWWHFLWSKDLLTFEQFTPLRGGRHKRLFPPLLFTGYIKTGADQPRKVSQ
jgi:hypothetical protein